MLNLLLGLEKSQDVTAWNVYCNGSWIVALVLLIPAAALAFYLYRSETRLSRQRRIVMGVCKVLALLMVILMILEPVAGVQLVVVMQPGRRCLAGSSRASWV